MNTEEEHESEYTIYEYFPQNTSTGEEFKVGEIISDNDDDFSLNVPIKWWRSNKVTLKTLPVSMANL